MKIATHNGPFHCDEALACYMLKLLPEYHNAEVVRTRDDIELDKCDIVVDVGGVFSHEKQRYDHHMKDFSHTFHSLVESKPWTTKLSSAGLIYIYYGERVVRLIMESIAKSACVPTDSVTDDKVTLVYNKIYQNFIEEIDAIDNGIEQKEGEERYEITTTLSWRVNRLNPQWNEPEVDENQRFHKAMELVGKEFSDRIKYYQLGWLPARELVKEAVQKRYDVHSSGEVIVIRQVRVPWEEHLVDIEEELSLSPLIKYVLSESNNRSWRVRCVPIKPNGFSNRLSLPEKWRGCFDEQLCELTGIADCKFVHANGFIGVNKTYNGALQMASESLRLGGLSK